MKLLFINACVRGEKSRTLRLAKGYISKYEKQGWEIEELNLDEAYNQGLLKVQDREELELREKLIQANDFSDPMFDMARQFMSADDIVIAAPYWDLQFPALLKIYLERISVADLTFTYNEIGIPCGNTKSKHATYISTAGGPTIGMDFGYEYINGLLTKLFSFENVDEIMVACMDQIGMNPEELLSEVENTF